ncbi:MAG: hypothetical protein JW832_05745 [Deltaproteobacteria bacterium]|nr:hypothetical protein [Deltaproteobacteria bacterium]
MRTEDHDNQIKKSHQQPGFAHREHVTTPSCASIVIGARSAPYRLSSLRNEYIESTRVGLVQKKIQAF